jgi:hypothetical protein
VIVCILFSKKSIILFVRSFVRLFFIFFSREHPMTGPVRFSRIVLCFFFFLYIHTYHSNLSVYFVPCIFFLLRVVILKEKRIYICVRVCVFFFIAPFFSLPSNQNKQTKIVSVHVFFFLSSVTNFKQKR